MVDTGVIFGLSDLVNYQWMFSGERESEGVGGGSHLDEETLKVDNSGTAGVFGENSPVSVSPIHE